MDVLTKIKIIEKLHTSIGLSRSECSIFLDAFFSKILYSLKEGKNIKIANTRKIIHAYVVFGCFQSFSDGRYKFSKSFEQLLANFQSFPFGFFHFRHNTYVRFRLFSNVFGLFGRTVIKEITLPKTARGTNFRPNTRKKTLNFEPKYDWNH